jgi:hypothetical protein
LSDLLHLIGRYGYLVVFFGVMLEGELAIPAAVSRTTGDWWGAALEEVDGNQRRTVYNTLGVTVWAAKTKGDPIRTVFSALGGEEVCRSDATSTR